MTNETKWSLDQANSKITFKVGHIIISNIRGSFKIFDASIYTKENEFSTAEINLWIDASSIISGDGNRDVQLRGQDFFDVQKHPQITFSSSTIGEPDEEGNRELWGELTIKGIKKVVKLNMKDHVFENNRSDGGMAKITISGKFNRSDWDLYGKSSFEFGGMMVSKDVKLLCDIQLINMGKNTSMGELNSQVNKNVF